jgi:hypothetical protein
MSASDFKVKFESGFAADMKAAGIHVGMGQPPRCVNCGESWPCLASGSLPEPEGKQ